MSRILLRHFAAGIALVAGLSPVFSKAAWGVPAPATRASSATKSQDPTKLKDWKTAEEFDFDWQGNGAPAHFKIEQSQEEQVARLTIRMKGQPDFVLNNNDDVWDEFKNDFTAEEKFLSKNKNLAPSRYAYALSPSTTGKLRPLLFLVTPQYASDPGNLFVLALDSSQRPKVILKTSLHILDFRDLDADGMAEIIGQPCFSQGWGHDFLTYDPFHVYRLQASAQPELTLSLPLTEKYNREHYYGWAGPDCSEDLAVVLHPPGGGKPVIVKSKEAEKMFTKKK
jgi:hypothetical protein